MVKCLPTPWSRCAGARLPSPPQARPIREPPNPAAACAAASVDVGDCENSTQLYVRVKSLSSHCIHSGVSDPGTTGHNRLALPVQKTTVLQSRMHSAHDALDPGRKTPRQSTPGKSTRRLTTRRSAAALVETVEKSEAVGELMKLLEPGQPLGGFSAFAKAYADEAFCGRLLRKYSGNLPKSAEKLNQALVWREKHQELLTSRKFEHGGDYRVIGSDLAKRPVLYMCHKNQFLPSSQCLNQQVVCILQAIDNMPPGVETATHIWDVHGMMLRYNLNPSPLLEMLKSTECYFAERMHELIILEMPPLATFLKDAVWPLIPQKTREKIKFMTVDQAKVYLGRSCDAEVSSRISAVIDQNRDNRLSLEDRKRTWMRVDEHGDLVPAFM